MLQSLGGATSVMPHLTCVGVSREALGEIAHTIYNLGFRNVMALRGDPPQGQASFAPHQDGLAHASDLVALLKEQHPDFCCGVAGYPETHLEASSTDDDISHLKKKVEAGAGFITSQLFFENESFFRWVDRCRAAGIETPIVAGLLPVLSLKQIKRFCSLCGASLPLKLEDRLKAAGEDGLGAQQVGIDWMADQIRGLLGHGVAGVHLYVLNRSRAALDPSVRACFELPSP